MAFSGEGALGGAAAGAGIGSFGGPLGAGIGAGIGGIAGGLGLFGKKKNTMPDISGELAKISSLFAQLRQNNTDNINYQAGQGRRAAASNLAARGIYRAPVSENTFNQLEGDRLRSIASSNASLAGQEAGLRSSLLNALLGYNLKANQLANQGTSQVIGSLGNIGGSLLLANLMKGRTAGTGAGGVSYNPPPAANYVMRPEDRLPALMNFLGVPA